MINGIEGFLSGHIMDLSKELSDEDLELYALHRQPTLVPAAISCLKIWMLPFTPFFFEKFEQLNIGAVFYIGGNDSMDTADKLSRWAAHNNKEISFIGVPKTIDNDLPVTDHTPGYGSAARYVASTVREIVLTPPFTSSRPLPLWSLWAVMQAGSPQPAVLPASSKETILSLFICRKLHLKWKASLLTWKML